jgi:predicted metal-dependent hydrolase
MKVKRRKPEYRDGNGFIAEIIRTDRQKTADIRVEDGVVSVHVPLGLSNESVDGLLRDKRTWIKSKILSHKEACPVSDKQFVSGEAFPYLGRNYRLKVEQGEFQAMRLYQGRLHVVAPEGSARPQVIRNALVRWYKRQAELKLRQKVIRYSEIVRVEPNGIRVKTFKNRWGSCTQHGRVEFNWRIMLSPNRCVDYVVIHELCHLKHHDHSPEFWSEVERVMPDYRDCREWLKVNAARTIF